jgi:integrase
VLLCDGGGLWLQVGLGKDKQVTKSWIFRYATAGTKVSRTGREYRRERQMGLGALYTVGLAEAREMARQARLLVQQGKDPIDERDTAKGAAAAARGKRVTFDQATEAYLQKFEDSWKNRAHRRQWRSTMREYVLPVLGKIDVAVIDTDAVLRVLDPIWSQTPETASRVRGRIESVLDFAGRNGSNPARWKGHLEHRLAKRNKTRAVKKLPALPYEQISTFMAELRAVDGVGARALEFTILCATRTNETVGAIWAEIDLVKRTWTIPVERLKRPGEQEDGSHCIPLSDAAVAVLNRIAEIRQVDRVFPIGEQMMRRSLKDLRSGVTVHGFRSTFRSWSGGRTGHPRDVCEMALGHAVGSAVERAYQRDALLAKRRVLMSDWADFCGKAPADVVRMDVGRQEIPRETKGNSMNSDGGPSSAGCKRPAGVDRRPGPVARDACG